LEVEEMQNNLVMQDLCTSHITSINIRLLKARLRLRSQLTQQQLGTFIGNPIYIY